MNLMNIVAKLTLDSKEYESGISKAAGAVKKGLGTAAKVGAVAIGAATTAVAALGKQAISSYADFEQLEGGIQTLYGENSEAAQKMMDQASKAWKTAGMSANEYMETAIASSASLISSLGGDTDEAARLMDMSIIDMSDNVNKMGTSMEAVSNAYRGFSRGNFNMLDNLALGYAGTKDGMQALLNKAMELEAQQGRTTKFSIDSYADIVQAIHIVQEEMGVSGTTAEEAEKTISGSLNAMKSAWTNLVTGLADDNADIGKLIDDLVTSIIGRGGEGGVLNNILPAIERALNGIMTLVTTAVPKIVPIIVDIIVSNLPMLIDAGMQVLVALIGGLAQALPQLIAAIPEIIRTIVNGLQAAWPQIKAAGIELGQQLWDGLKNLASEAWSWGADLIGNFIDGIWAKANELWDSVKGIAQGVRNFLGFSEPKEGPLSDFHTYAPDMMKLFAQGIKDNEDMLYDTVADAFDFGDATITASENANKGVGASTEPITFISKVILNDRVIGEAVAKYQRNAARAYG